MKKTLKKYRPLKAGQVRSQWLAAIRDYVCANNLPPVFRFRPGQLMLSTFRCGGDVNLECKSTGHLIPLNILAWPLVSASVTKAGKTWVVELVESQPGIACGPLEQLWRVRVDNKITVPFGKMDRDGWLPFPTEVHYDLIGQGFETLSDEHLNILYTDVIEARPDLKVQ